MLQYRNKVPALMQVCYISICFIIHSLERKEKEVCRTKGRYDYNAYRPCENGESILIPIARNAHIPSRKSYNISTNSPGQKALIPWSAAFACYAKWER